MKTLPYQETAITHGGQSLAHAHTETQETSLLQLFILLLMQHQVIHSDENAVHPLTHT